MWLIRQLNTRHLVSPPCLDKIVISCVCVRKSLRTRVDGLLHFDGTDGSVRQRWQYTRVISIKGNTQKGCHGDHSPKPPGTKRLRVKTPLLQPPTHKHTYISSALKTRRKRLGGSQWPRMGATEEVQVSDSRHNFGNYLPVMMEKDNLQLCK